MSDKLEASIRAASGGFVSWEELLPQQKAVTDSTLPSDFPGQDFPSPDFPGVVASRRQWIDSVLRPWCQIADERSLQMAEHHWVDLAGNVNPQVTLWRWAWSRFADLISSELGFNESVPFAVTLNDSTKYHGYIDGRKSRANQLFIVTRDAETQRMVTLGPFSLSSIQSVSLESPDGSR